MKNVRIKIKLMISFSLVAVIALIVGVVGVLQMRSLSGNESAIYLYSISTNRIIELQRNIQEQRAGCHIAAMQVSGGAEAGGLSRLEALDSEFREEMNWLLANAAPVLQSALREANNLYLNSYYPAAERLAEAVRDGDARAAAASLAELEGFAGSLQASLDQTDQLAIQTMTEMERDDARTAGRLVLVLLGLSLAALALGVFFAFYISHLIADPLQRMASESTKLSVGNTDVFPDIDQDDEIGLVDKALWTILRSIIEQEEGIVRLAEGDFTVHFPIRSDKDTMHKSLNTLVDTFNIIMEEIHGSAVQVNAGAAQIAHSSQELAAGSSEQAATIEELGASLTTIQSMAEDNSVNSAKTLSDFQRATQMMEECNRAMDQMTSAMADINAKSQSINKVIKVIDDIAFQTNILALNAAVEAARAGAHGKGFAVVADEVRNLASKSAEAAQETATLIQQSIRSVSEGNGIVDVVGTSIHKVGDLVGRNNESLAHIDEASFRQKDAIAEVTSGIIQLNSVVQANNNNAESMAASSQEMAAQATAMEDILGRFKLKRQHGQLRSVPTVATTDGNSSTAFTFSES